MTFSGDAPGIHHPGMTGWEPRLATDATEVFAAGNGRYDADHVIFFQGSLFLLQKANVFVANVNIDEATELACVVVKMLAEVAILGGDGPQCLSNRLCLHFHRLLLLCILSQRSRDDDLNRHYFSFICDLRFAIDDWRLKHLIVL